MANESVPVSRKPLSFSIAKIMEPPLPVKLDHHSGAVSKRSAVQQQQVSRPTATGWPPYPLLPFTMYGGVPVCHPAMLWTMSHLMPAGHESQQRRSVGSTPSPVIKFPARHSPATSQLLAQSSPVAGNLDAGHKRSSADKKPGREEISASPNEQHPQRTPGRPCKTMPPVLGGQSRPRHQECHVRLMKFSSGPSIVHRDLLCLFVCRWSKGKIVSRTCKRTRTLRRMRRRTTRWTMKKRRRLWAKKLKVTFPVCGPLPKANLSSVRTAARSSTRITI
jgi:hypothetical protein